MLSVAAITKSFPTRREPLEVLRGVTLQLETGQSCAIVGPSGCGKSTLLHILGTLDRPTSGSLQLDGVDPFQLDDAGLARFRNRHVGFVFQDHHLLPQLSVLENVLLPALAAGRPDRATADRGRELLDRVGLGQRLEHRPAELSGGERQRAGVARALLLRPQLLLADEPTGNLDRTTALAVGRLLVDVHRQEATVMVVVTHSRDLAAMLPQTYELDGGELRPAGQRISIASP